MLLPVPDAISGSGRYFRYRMPGTKFLTNFSDKFFDVTNVMYINKKLTVRWSHIGIELHSRIRMFADRMLHGVLTSGTSGSGCPRGCRRCCLHRVMPRLAWRGWWTSVVTMTSMMGLGLTPSGVATGGLLTPMGWSVVGSPMFWWGWWGDRANFVKKLRWIVVTSTAGQSTIFVVFRL